MRKSSKLTSNMLIVDNINSGIVINNLFNQWNVIRTDEDTKNWQREVKNTKFGTYGTISIFEILERFKPIRLNKLALEHFYKEIEIALNTNN